MGRRKAIRRVVCTAVVIMAVVVVTIVLLVRYSTVEDKVDSELAVPDLPACIMRGPDCNGPLCCNKTVTEVFSNNDFDGLFPYRNSQLSHAQSFYEYSDFIRAAEMFERKGFGLIGGDDMQKREIAAFLAHVAAMSSCGSANALGGPYLWGLCMKEEAAPNSIYCQESLENPCVDGVSYHGRGPMFVTWNYNYNWIGKGLNLDLLHRPDWLENNATLAFASCIYQWMTPRNGKPSPHSVMVGQWKPSLNDTNGKRFPGFGTTINILSPKECGHGYDDIGTKRVGHYNKFLGLLGNVPSGGNVDCNLQEMWITDPNASN